MNSKEQNPAGGAAAGTASGFTPAQSSALLRSASAIACELMAGSFPTIVEMVKEGLAARWDFDAAAPLVQRMLYSKDKALCAAFTRHLPEFQEMALDRLFSARSLSSAPLRLDADDLELVENTESGGDAVAGRAARRMRGAVEEPLRELHLIVEYLSGRENVPQADDPFGPDACVPALLQSAIDLDLDPEAWVFFVQAFEAEFASELERVCRALLDHFRVQGVDPRAIRRALGARRAPAAPNVPGMPVAGARQGASGPGPRGVAAPGGGKAEGALGPGVGGGAGGHAGPGQVAGGAAAGAGADAGRTVVHGASESLGVATDAAGAERILHDLLSRLQSNVAGGVLPPIIGSQGTVAPRLLDALGELQNLGLEGIHGAMFAGSPAGSINAWREHLISQSDRTVDKLTIEIVGMLFDHVLRDSQVPSEIKALLSRLQFPVLKAALLDAAFFASSSHPARRLIDRIAAAAVGWEPYGDENERFRAEVDRIVTDVIQQFERDVSLFDRMLERFESFLGDAAPRDSDPIARAKRALEEAEKREILTINTTIQVRRVFERIDIESWLREFLVGPWVQVLVQASLRDDHTRGYSKSFREAIHEMVWSVQPKATAEERRRLVELIPALTRVVRDGLALIRFAQRDEEEFLQKLMAAHAFAVKPTDQATYIRNAVQSSDVRARIEGMQMTASFPLTAVPGGVRVPAGAVLRAAAEHEVDLTVPAPLTDAGPIGKAEEARLDHDLSHWTRGSWFELWDGKAFIKARLRWISPLRTLYMFSSGANNRAHVMTPELIRSYLRRDYIRLLEDVPLTERAASAVVADFATQPERASELATRVTVV